MAVPKIPSAKNQNAVADISLQALKRWFAVVDATCVVGTSFPKKSVASILEADLERTIQCWMALVEHEDELTCVRLSVQDRTGHLPQLFRDLIHRLRLPTVTAALGSDSARQHGEQRRLQGYTPPMLVEESRILEVSIIMTLQNNLPIVDFRKLLLDIITVADECDSQLKQAVLGYVETVTTWSAA